MKFIHSILPLGVISQTLDNDYDSAEKPAFRKNGPEFKQDIRQLKLNFFQTIREKSASLDEISASQFENFMLANFQVLSKQVKDAGNLNKLMVRNGVDPSEFVNNDISGERAINNCESPTCTIPLTLSGIWGYGCWCHFGSRIGQGKGAAVNPMDSVCERMQKCLRCAEFDAANADDPYLCDIQTVNYNSTFSNANNVNAIAAGCSERNPNSLCSVHVCTCEMQMINEILGLMWQSYTYDPAFRHASNPNGGTFDFSASCRSNTGSGGNDVETQCCGKYPSRSPFHKADKECCEATQTIFNPIESECCANEVIKISDGGCL